MARMVITAKMVITARTESRDPKVIRGAIVYLHQNRMSPTPPNLLSSLLVLIGEKGDHGKDGMDGKNGMDGKEGYNGSDGKDGIDGKDGMNGKDGYNGKDGEQGPQGDSWCYCKPASEWSFSSVTDLTFLVPSFHFPRW